MIRGNRSILRTSGAVAVALGLAITFVLAGSPAAAGARSAAARGDDDHDGFRQVNLVSDIPGLAQLTDPAVVNPWGISFGATTPLWVANNGVAPGRSRSLITLYAGATRTVPAVTKLGLAVEADSPTGTVFNGGIGFSVTQNGQSAPSRFLFNENLFDSKGVPTGEISGWHPTTPAPPTTTVVTAHRTGAFYSGLALLDTGKAPRLLAADFAGRIDAFDANFKPIPLPSWAFVDRSVGDLTPYNVAVFDHRVYIAFAAQGKTGAISVFTESGRLLKRLVTVGQRGNHLVGPWGMAVAPKNWGGFGGDLLVGNVEDGRINAYDLRSGHFRGTLRDSRGNPIVNMGLWGIAFGNNVIGTPRTLIFAAGIGDNPHAPNIYEHGLVGLIAPDQRDDD
jgi:uncharacterized protein (TIGR03118 family)